MKATTEKAFETYIEETMAAGGWLCGSKTSWDKDNALFREEVLAFIQDTQPGLWSQMEKLHGSNKEEVIEETPPTEEVPTDAPAETPTEEKKSE